ncbi:MAG: 3'-5' exonuclease [Spirochaetaceae bacterium]|nr:3'-5' exonuclease [Spirochaetaceae bacterium]
MFKYTLIDTDDKFRDIIKYWKENNMLSIAMDFEGEFNLHVYGEHLCLVQLFDTKQYYLADPFELSQEMLKEFFEDTEIEKIMFSCDSDSALVRKQYDIQLKNIYDVRIPAMELEFMGNYTALVKRNLDVTIETAGSKKKNQMTNWLKRPLKEDQIQYALLDVAYLYQLKESLIIETEAAGLTKAVNSKMKMAAVHKGPDKPGWAKLGNYKRMSHSERIYLKHFFIARDIIAKKENVPAARILDKRKLVTMAKDVPSTDRELKYIIHHRDYRIERQLYPLMKKAMEDSVKELSI